MTNIYELIDYWHKNEVIPPCPLHQFLGMNYKDYKSWVEGTLSQADLSGYGYTDD